MPPAKPRRITPGGPPTMPVASATATIAEPAPGQEPTPTPIPARTHESPAPEHTLVELAALVTLAGFAPAPCDAEDRIELRRIVADRLARELSR